MLHSLVRNPSPVPLNNSHDFRGWRLIGIRDLEPQQIPDGSSTTRIMQQLGGAFGAATLAVVLQSNLVGHPTSTAYAASFWGAIAFTAVAAVPALFLPAVRR